MIYFGDALKAMDDSGKVGGYLVRFSDGSKKDLSGEYFTAETYLGAHDGDGVDTMFHHGQPLPIKAKLTKEAMAELDGLRDHVFAPVKTKRDTIGIFAETVLDMSDAYEKAVFGLVKAGKLGWSSGAVGHLVKKANDGRILRWPVGEASITPTPCEPLNRAITVKSLDAIKFVSVIEDSEPQLIPDKPTGLAAKLSQHIDDLVDDGRTRAAIIGKMAREASIEASAVESMLSNEAQPTDANLKAFARVLNVSFDALKASVRHDHLQTIKGMFEEALASEPPDRWKLESVYCNVVKKLAYAASAAQMAGVEFDLEGKLSEATTEYSARLQDYALGEINDWVSEGGQEDFYLKAILDAQASVKALANADLDTHSQFTVSVLRGISSRFRGNHEGRVKAGRVLSEKNRQRISDLMGQMDAVKAEFQKLLDESMPMASETQKRAVIVKNLLRRQQQRQSMGV